MRSLIDQRSVRFARERNSCQPQAGNQAGNRTQVRSATRVISLPYIAYPDHCMLTEILFSDTDTASLFLDRISKSRRKHHEVGATWKL